MPDLLEMSYHWQTAMHLNMGDQFVLLQRCPELGICKQTTTQRKGYRVLEEVHFFANENGPDDPTYTLKEILVEAEYRKALQERDAIEQETSHV